MSPLQWLRIFQSGIAIPEVPVSYSGHRSFQCGEFNLEAKVVSDGVLVKTADSTHRPDGMAQIWTYTTQDDPEAAIVQVKRWLRNR